MRCNALPSAIRKAGSQPTWVRVNSREAANYLRGDGLLRSIPVVAGAQFVSGGSCAYLSGGDSDVGFNDVMDGADSVPIRFSFSRFRLTS
jgi:hypothetical protein